MEIEILKYTSKEETEYLKITGYSVITKPKNLLLFTEDFAEEPDGEKNLLISINTVEFIASCKTKFENEILVAFYLREHGELAGHIISDLPNGYQAYSGYLINYKSYEKLCDLTGEKKLNLIDYFEHVKAGYVGANSYLKRNEKYLNYDAIKVFWDSKSH